MPVLNVSSGQYAIIEQNGKICSNFGTCVGIILFDKKNVRAGLAHALLPNPESNAYFSSTNTAMKDDMNFLSVLFIRMLKDLKQRGSFPQDLSAVIVGANFGDKIKQAEIVARANYAEAIKIVEFWKFPLLKDATLNSYDGHVEFSLPEFSIKLVPKTLS